MEARQLAFVEKLTRFADRRAQRAAQVIRQLGLDPGAMLGQLDERAGQGGPFVKLATAADGSLSSRKSVSLSRSEKALSE